MVPALWLVPASSTADHRSDPWNGRLSRDCTAGFEHHFELQLGSGVPGGVWHWHHRGNDADYTHARIHTGLWPETFCEVGPALRSSRRLHQPGVWPLYRVSDRVRQRPVHFTPELDPTLIESGCASRILDPRLSVRFASDEQQRADSLEVLQLGRVFKPL